MMLVAALEVAFLLQGADSLEARIEARIAATPEARVAVALIDLGSGRTSLLSPFDDVGPGS